MSTLIYESSISAIVFFHKDSGIAVYEGILPTRYDLMFGSKITSDNEKKGKYFF